MGAGLALEGVRVAIGELAAADISRLSVRELAGELEEITAAANLLEAERLRRLVAFDGADGSRELGQRSSASYLTFRLGLEPGAAAERVTLARQAGVLGATHRALAAGAITYQQAAIISHTAASLDPAAAPQLEEVVLPQARDGVDPVRLRDFARGVAATIDAEVLRRDSARAQRARYVTLGPDRDGIAHLHGRLDIELSAYLRALLDGREGIPAKDDDRSPGQRRHDALKSLCREMLQGAVTLGKRRGRAVRPVLTASEQTWNTGVGPPVMLNHRIAIDVDTARTMAEGAKPTRVDSLGREDGGARAFSAAQRGRLDKTAGGYCEWPEGCGQPAEWSEGNHVVPYSKGGPTVVANGDTMCRFHNQLLEHGWRVLTDEDGRRRVYGPDRAPPTARAG